MKRISTALALLAVFALLCFFATRGTDGAFIYPVDDAYIHLSLARSLAERGVYAVSGDAFAPASSSILYPFVLAALYRVTAPLLGHAVQYLPLVVNGVALVAVARLFETSVQIPYTNARSHWARPFAMGPFIALLLVPILPLAMSGMEHTLHVAAVLWLVRLAMVPAQGRRHLVLVFAAASLAASLRYESIFVVAALALVLLLDRSFRALGALLAGAALPVALFGLFLEQRAGIFFPASVLLKREHLTLASAPATLFFKWAREPHLAGLVVAFVVVAWLTKKRAIASNGRSWTRGVNAELFVAALVLVMHVTFAKTGWLYRYEAYAIVLALRAMAITLGESKIRSRACLLALSVAFLPLTFRAVVSFRAVVLASRNIFEQQVQTARFLALLGSPRAALNDIGAPSYFSRATVKDLMGLGDLEAARVREFRIERGLTREEVQQLSRGVDVAVLFPGWFEGAIPEDWTPLESWTIFDNRVAAKDTVTIYAPSSRQIPGLLSALDAFHPSMPPRVQVLRLRSLP